jgi:type IV secretion system protein VirB9
MTRLLPAAALALLALSAPLHAQDPRLVERFYDPAEVVRIEGKANVQTTIRFAEDELIENVAIGDSESWQVTPNKRANLLFLKPLAERASTNMTVVTNNHTYFFDLVASPKNENPLYVLSFSYPEEIDPAPARQLEAEQPNEVEMAAATEPETIVDPAQLNFAWEGNGDRKLLPSRIYDDGAATFLAWPAGTPVPAILVKDKAGTEGPVNFAVRGDVIVIEGVPRQIILRSGKDVATIGNNGPERPRAALAQLDEVK